MSWFPWEVTQCVSLFVRVPDGPAISGGLLGRKKLMNTARRATMWQNSAPDQTLRNARRDCRAEVSEVERHPSETCAQSLASSLKLWGGQPLREESRRPHGESGDGHRAVPERNSPLAIWLRRGTKNGATTGEAMQATSLPGMLWYSRPGNGSRKLVEFEALQASRKLVYVAGPVTPGPRLSASHGSP